MDAQNTAATGYGYNMDFNNLCFGPATEFSSKPSEGNTQNDFTSFFGDEGIDIDTTATMSLNPSFDSMNSHMFTMPAAEPSFAMPQNLAMDNTLGDASSWNTQLDFASAPMPQYQLNDNMKRPLQVDTQDFPQSKRHEGAHYASNFTSPYLPSESLTASSWTMVDAQATPCSSSAEVGLSDEAADVCATWFSKYAVLPNDRHIDSLSQLTGEPAGAIRTWFGQMLKQGLAGHDSAYKSRTSLSLPDLTLDNAITQTQNETSLVPYTQDTTTTSPPAAVRGGKKKGCTPTNDPELLRADSKRIYQCTRKCGKRYVRKCDWKRNEEEGYPSKSWVCSLCVSQGVEKVKPCYRRYHFAQHFRNIHPGVDSTEYEETSLVHSDTAFPRRCGFCPHRFDSRQDRIDHIAAHFKKGKCMLDWNDDEEENNDSDDVDGDDDNDDNNDNDNDSNGFSDEFQGGSGPSDKRSGNQDRPDDSQGGSEDGGNGDGYGSFGPFGTLGDFNQFQLSPAQNSGTTQSLITEQGFKKGYEEDIIIEGQLSPKDQGEQPSVQQHTGQISGKKQRVPSPLPQDPQQPTEGQQQSIQTSGKEQCVPCPPSWDPQTARDDTQALARNVIASLSQTPIQGSISLEEAKKLWTVFSGLVQLHEPESLLLKEKEAPRLSLLPPPPIPVPDDGEGTQVTASGNQTQEDGLLHQLLNRLPVKGQPDALIQLFSQGSLSDIWQKLNVEISLNGLRPSGNLLTAFLDEQKLRTDSCMGLITDQVAFMNAKSKIQQELKEAVLQEQANHTPQGLSSAIGNAVLQFASRLAGLQTQLQDPGTLQKCTGVSQLLESADGVTEQEPELDPSSPAEWSEIAAHIEDSYLKSQSFLSVKLLGSGGFSTVDEVVHQQTELRISRKTLKNRQPSAVQELKKEVEVLQKLRHPHIIRFLGAYSKGDKVSILLSPVAETTLAVWLEQCHANRPLGLADTVLKMFGCLASSIRYLHEQRPVIKHMDIKPQNILVMRGSDDIPHVVLSDFGISSSDGILDESPKAMTRRYCAPEVSLGTSRGRAADIFSLGCVFIEMLSAGFGERSPNWEGFRKEFSGGKYYYWEHVPRLQEWLVRFLDQATTPKEATALRTVKSMLNSEPTERPSAAMVTMVFTPASCCLSWPNESTIYPGPIEELRTLDVLLRQEGHAQLPNARASCAHAQEPFAHAKAWLQDCSQNHEACLREVSDKNVLPTRLLDIRPEGGLDASFIRLVNSTDIRTDSDDNKVNYVAVSHTWADTDLTLSSSSLQTLQTKLPQAMLSQSLRDVIVAAQNIGSRYLWIDSLCVLQDSLEDKKRECATMASIYRNAILTIVVGEYTERTARTAGPPLSSNTTTTNWQAPGFAWDTRAWVFQERLLCGRLLHLTGEQLYWECNGLKASETFPRGLPSLVWEKVHTKPRTTSPLTPRKAASSILNQGKVVGGTANAKGDGVRVSEHECEHNCRRDASLPSAEEGAHPLLDSTRTARRSGGQFQVRRVGEGEEASCHAAGTHTGKAQMDMSPDSSSRGDLGMSRDDVDMEMGG